MNVYDFDKTVFSGDSTTKFYFFVLRRNPKLWLKCPKVSAAGVQLLTGRMSLRRFKETLFRSFLPNIDVDKEVRAFWKHNRRHMKKWYLKQLRDDDVISSASPEFLLMPIAEKLGVRLIASPVDPQSGALTGPNNRHIEKVRRFRERFPQATVDEFYSDSVRSDGPMAEMAKKAYLVKGNQIKPWPR